MRAPRVQIWRYTTGCFGVLRFEVSGLERFKIELWGFRGFRVFSVLAPEPGTAELQKPAMNLEQAPIGLRRKSKP